MMVSKVAEVSKKRRGTCLFNKLDDSVELIEGLGQFGGKPNRPTVVCVASCNGKRRNRKEAMEIKKDLQQLLS